MQKKDQLSIFNYLQISLDINEVIYFQGLKFITISFKGHLKITYWVTIINIYGSESDHFNNILITHDIDLNFGTSFITQLSIDLFFPCQHAKI